MQEEPLYKRVPQKGKHPAKSKRTPGAISGAALDDKTNKPSGASDFIPVGLTEEDVIRTQKKVLFWGGLAQIGMDYASARFQEWWYYRALPKLHYEIIPAGKKKASELFSRVIRRGNESNQSESQDINQGQISTEHDSSLSKRTTTVTLPADLDGAYEYYSVNMTSEEAQKELFEAFVLQVISMKKFQKLSHARIIDCTGNITNGEDVIRKLADPAVIKSINQLLEGHPYLLDEWQAKALGDALGRALIKDNCYVPIKRDELFPDTLE